MKKKREFDFGTFDFGTCVIFFLSVIGMIYFVLLVCESVAPVIRNDHLCDELGCDETISGNARYCKIHQIRRDAKEKANNNASKKTTDDSGTQTPSSRNNYTYNYKRTTTSMPDCDDYDSYDDFMDDWDGNMPDGSDASDYWDDW